MCRVLLGGVGRAHCHLKPFYLARNLRYLLIGGTYMGGSPGSPLVMFLGALLIPITIIQICRYYIFYVPIIKNTETDEWSVPSHSACIHPAFTWYPLYIIYTF